MSIYYNFTMIETDDESAPTSKFVKEKEELGKEILF
jgi:hypothetical protein